MYFLTYVCYINLITCHYYAYANVYILVPLSVFEFASVGLSLVRFTLTKGAGVPVNCVITCVNKAD